MKYSGEYTREISFPLGGIGTGSIGFDGGGRLIDWEIFGRPSKGSYNGYTHFAIKTVKDGKPLTYILNGDFNKELMGQYMKKQFCGYGFGPLPQTMCGFPHFSKSEFIGEFPIATLKLHDDLFPADIRMTAFNPFIPCDEKNSSLPAAFFEIETENTSDIPLDFDIAFSVANPYDVSANEAYSDGTIRAVTLRNADECGKESTSYGDLTVATDLPLVIFASLLVSWKMAGRNCNVHERICVGQRSFEQNIRDKRKSRHIDTCRTHKARNT